MLDGGDFPPYQFCCCKNRCYCSSCRFSRYSWEAYYVRYPIRNPSIVIPSCGCNGCQFRCNVVVGFAQSQEKPLLLIARGSRSIPFDLAQFPVVIYDSTNTNEFVERLSKSIIQVLKTPSAFLFEKVVAEREKSPNVFISYNHSDREYIDRLLVHLKPLEKEGLIDLWIDTRLRAGDRWKKEIEKALSRATVAILVVSADFLASDFITDNELPPLLRNAEEKGTRIVPMIVKPCRFTRDKNLRHFQAINDPKKSFVLLPFGEQEVLYDKVAIEVERWLQMG